MDPDSCQVFFIQLKNHKNPDSWKSYALQRSIPVQQNYVTKTILWQDGTELQG